MIQWNVTDEIELQPIKERHAEALFALTNANRQYLREWLPWLDGTRTVNDTKAFVETRQKALADKKGLTAGIWLKGSLCGMISHEEFDGANRSTALGYWVAASHQGKGIVTACCRALIAHTFAELGLNRIVIRCATGNHRSRAVPERLGFQFEGIARQAEWLYDHFVDQAVYSLLRTDDSALKLSIARLRVMAGN
jgi:ribosomal-protein-serine acetyltransferase